MPQFPPLLSHQCCYALLPIYQLISISTSSHLPSMIQLLVCNYGSNQVQMKSFSSLERADRIRHIHWKKRYNSHILTTGYDQTALQLVSISYQSLQHSNHCQVMSSDTNDLMSFFFIFQLLFPHPSHFHDVCVTIPEMKVFSSSIEEQVKRQLLCSSLSSVLLLFPSPPCNDQHAWVLLSKKPL